MANGLSPLAKHIRVGWGPSAWRDPLGSASDVAFLLDATKCIQTKKADQVMGGYIFLMNFSGGGWVSRVAMLPMDAKKKGISLWLSLGGDLTQG